MQIKLYSNTSDNYEMPKKITQIGNSISGTLRDITDCINPVIQTVTDPRTANYCEIPEFNRFYYITSIRNIKNGLWEIECKCDVLQSFYNEIKESKIIVNRNSEQFNTYLQDENRKFYQYGLTEYRIIGTVGKPNTAIFVTVG